MKYFKVIGGLVAIALVMYLVLTQLLFKGEVGENEGKFQYERYCGDCHGKDGLGYKELYPPIAGADYFKKMSLGEVICMLDNGMEGDITVNGKAYTGKMPKMRDLSRETTDVDIVNIVNYIRQTWGEQTEYVTPKALQEERSKCK